MALRAGLLAAVLAAASAFGIAAEAHSAPALDRLPHGPRYEPGRAIVAFEPGTDAAERSAVRRGARVSFGRSLSLPRTQVVHFEGSVPSAVARLQDRPGVAYAQPDYRYDALAADTFFGQLWGLDDSAAPSPGVDAAPAWSITKGAGQVIAVVDSGVDLTHPDLDGNLWTNPGERLNGVDDDGNGRSDDVHGFDFVDGDGDPDDHEFHGTHVAGTAAAELDNSEGVAGVAPQARIMAVRVLDGNGSGSSSGIGAGIAYAAREGATVINLSLGGPAGAGDSFLASAIAEADLLNVTVVAAAGNEGSDNDSSPTTPCTIATPNLICVAAVNQAGGLAGFSNFGAITVDVGAPGTDIVSAKSDWGPPLFAEGFEAGVDPAIWVPEVVSGAAWGESGTSSEGAKSAADSPSGNYAPNTNSWLVKQSPVDLTSQRGCRMHFDLSLALAPGFDSNGVPLDEFDAGAFTDDSGVSAGAGFAGTNGGFEPTEVSIADLDGRADVYPAFGLFSDGSGHADGAYVDDLRVLCRASGPYVDAITPLAGYDEATAGNYVAFAGTSMASPHVAGVAALVRAADPGVPDTQVVAAIRSGAASLPALTGKTVSGGVASGPGAIAAALALPNTSAGDTGTGTVTPPPPTPTAPAPLDLSGVPARLRISSSRRFSYSFKAAPGMRGTLTFRTRRKVRPRRGAAPVHLTVGRRSFTSPSSGRVTVRVRLSRRHAAILRRNRRFLLRVGVSAQDSLGRVSRAGRRLTLLPPR